MSWETLEKKSFLVHNYGPEWEVKPMVSIRKDGLTFNRVFCETFSIKLGDGLCVLMDASRKKLGFKTPQTEHELLNAYYLHGCRSAAKKKRPRGKNHLLLSATRVAKIFPEAVGKAFVAHLNNGQHMIEVDLDADRVCNGEGGGR